jgi:hypothetical protein
MKLDGMMKRSQIVERIYDLLNCDGVLEYSMPKLEPVPLTEEHVRWIAEQIVQEIEQAGMLPPFKEPKKLSVMQDEEKYTMYYKWEPENETK